MAKSMYIKYFVTAIVGFILFYLLTASMLLGVLYAAKWVLFMFVVDAAYWLSADAGSKKEKILWKCVPLFALFIC